MSAEKMANSLDAPLKKLDTYEGDKQLMKELIAQRSDRLRFYERKNGRSFVWRKFVRVFLDEEETVFVKCIHCDDVFKNTNFTGTGSLLRHNCFQPNGGHELDASAHFGNNYTPNKSMGGQNHVTLGHILSASVGQTKSKANNGNTKLVSNNQLMLLSVDNESATLNVANQIKLKANDANDSDSNEDFSSAHLPHLLPEIEDNNTYNDKNFIKLLVRTNSERLHFDFKKGKSDVWHKFERIYVDNRETMFVKCKSCDDILKYVSSTGTGSLLRHNCSQALNTNNIKFEPTGDDNNYLRKCLTSQKNKSFSDLFANSVQTKTAKSLDSNPTLVRHDKSDNKCDNAIEFETSAQQIEVSNSASDSNDEFLGESVTHLLPQILDRNSCNDKNFIKLLVRTNSQRLHFDFKKGKSEVWHKFERIYVDNRETMFVKCKTCDDILKYVSSTGTGSLLRHNCHTRPCNLITTPDLQMFTDASHISIMSNVNNMLIKCNQEKPIDSDLSSIKSRIAETMAFCLVINSIPLSFFETKHFHSLAQTFVDIGATNGINVDINQVLPSVADIEAYVERYKSKTNLLNT